MLPEINLIWFDIVIRQHFTYYSVIVVRMMFVIVIVLVTVNELTAVKRLICILFIRWTSSSTARQRPDSSATRLCSSATARLFPDSGLPLCGRVSFTRSALHWATAPTSRSQRADCVSRRSVTAVSHNPVHVDLRSHRDAVVVALSVRQTSPDLYRRRKRPGVEHVHGRDVTDRQRRTEDVSVSWRQTLSSVREDCLTDCCYLPGIVSSYKGRPEWNVLWGNALFPTIILLSCRQLIRI